MQRAANNRANLKRAVDNLFADYFGGQPHRFDAGLGDGSEARIYTSSSPLSYDDKALVVQLSEELLRIDSELQKTLAENGHLHLKLPKLLLYAAGVEIAKLFKKKGLRACLDAGLAVGQFELVLSRGNEQPKSTYRRRKIRNMLACDHQDIRAAEEWFQRDDFEGHPGSTRIIYDLNPIGHRHFQFCRLSKDASGFFLSKEPIFKTFDDLVAFDSLGAGLRGFFGGGSSIFHSRRSRFPNDLGVTVSADVVVPYYQNTSLAARGLSAKNKTYMFFKRNDVDYDSRHQSGPRHGSRTPGSCGPSAEQSALARAKAAAAPAAAPAAAAAAAAAAAGGAGSDGDDSDDALAWHCFWCARPYFSKQRPNAWRAFDGRRWCEACKEARRKTPARYEARHWPTRPAVQAKACVNDAEGGGCDCCVV